MSVRPLTIEALIVHDLPAKGESEGPAFSEVASPLDPEARNFFEERVRSTLTHEAFPAVFDENSDSPLRAVVTRQLAPRPPDFVWTSRKIAQRLYDSQTRRESPGLLVVMSCQLGEEKGLAVLKLEKEEGVRVETESLKGKMTLSVKHIRDLMLTQRTRVFKIGLFIGSHKGVSNILVCDFQGHGTAGIASFFLHKFLGCKLAKNPDVLTRDFMEVTQAWINEEVGDPVTKSQYQVALVAELESNRSTITPSQFAKEHIRTRDRAPFIDALKREGAPATRFPKDTELVKRQLKRIQYAFTNEITVACPPALVDEKLKVRSLDDGETQIMITGELDAVTGKSR